METGKFLNFTKAAESLYLPQPAVSRYISALEKELGTTLFIRESNRKITLSDAGKVYYNLFQRFQAEFENTQKLLADRSSVLRLGYNAGWNLSSFLPHVVTVCRDAVPDFRLNLECRGFQELLNALTEQKLDAIITMEDYLEKEPEVEFQRITSIRRTIVYSELLPGYAHIAEAADFYLYDFLLVDDPKVRTLVRETEEVFTAYQFFPRFTTVPNLDTVFAFVENGLGVALLDVWFQNLYAPRIHHIDLDHYLPIAIGWRRHTADSNIAVLRDALTAYFNNATPEPPVSPIE